MRLLLLLTLTLSAPASARTLQVGPDAELRTLADAARAAHDGDTVFIAPGEYFSCATWNANALVIEGAGPGVVLSDSACEGKASFVVNGHDVVVRNLTFTRVRVPDGNGA
ncbi:MAG TPA: right-handed parallel beta-helix repeat-containing protein, partial [Acetobacteraceae bacterium]